MSLADPAQLDLARHVLHLAVNVPKAIACAEIAIRDTLADVADTRRRRDTPRSRPTPPAARRGRR